MITDTKRPPVMYKLCEGVWAGEYPDGTTIRRLTDEGVVAYVDLTRWDEQWIYAIKDYGDLLPPGTKRFRFPLWTYWLPRAQRLWEIVRTVEENVPCYLHCRQGLDRTGMIAALILLHKGMSLDEALSHLRRARGADSPRKSYHVEYLKKMASAVAKDPMSGRNGPLSEARPGHE